MKELNSQTAPKTYTVQISSPQQREFNDKKLSFQELPQEWLEGLKKNGVVAPTPIQESTFYPVCDGLDVLAQSLTGSGKTLAFSLPLALTLAKAKKKPKNGRPFGLILTPTRELADQITKVFKTMLRPSKLQVVTIIGGVSYSKQEQALKRPVDIVVGTPGRIADLLKKQMLSLKDLKTFVLDEVDQMLDIGFAKELNLIRDHLPEKTQTLFFSATLNKETSRLANDLLNDPMQVKVKAANDTPKSIEHGYLKVKSSNKLSALVSCLVYYNPSQAIIFCETKKECADVAYTLSQKGFNVSQLNSDLNQYERQLAMKQFKQGQLQFLIATNVAARGIDIQELPLVVNYTPPKDRESYTHRVGRTGRAGATGKAWTMVSPNEFHWFQRLTKMVKADPKPITLPKGEVFLQTIVDRELAKLNLTELPRSINSDELMMIERSLDQLDPDQIRSFLMQIIAKSVHKFGITDPSKFHWETASTKPRLRNVKRFDRRGDRSFGYGQSRRRGNSSNRSSNSSKKPRSLQKRKA
ncbi:MAG: DEAD/DEAH box helicase [Oligoflexales bacterium]|nr:DEAD/DEAH box helicase [Oligoflexales bacterium]